MIATDTALADAAGYPRRPRRPSVAEALRAATPGTVAPASDRGRPVALVVLADRRAFVVDDRCPHDGGPLSDGFLDGDHLVCARHGWEIDPCQGTCGRRPVASRPVGAIR